MPSLNKVNINFNHITYVLNFNHNLHEAGLFNVDSVFKELHQMTK